MMQDRNAIRGSTVLSDLLVRIVRQTRIPGIGASVMKDGTIRSASVAMGPQGNPAPTAHLIRFDIGCITGMLTHLVALQLVRSGELDLQAPISFYLRDLPPNVRSARILLWHVLSHSSGYVGIAGNDRNATADFSWCDFLRFLARSQQVFRPGTVFNYHIADQAIVAEILTRRCGAGPLELVRRRILEPLDLGRPPAGDGLSARVESIGGHRWNGQSGAFESCTVAPTSAFWAPVLSGPPLTTHEMLRLAAAIINGGHDTGADIQTIDAVTSRLFQKQVVNVPVPERGVALSRALVSYGLGCGGYTDGSLGVCGTASGQTCAVHFDSTSRTAVALALNASSIAMRNRIGARLLAALRETASEPAAVVGSREPFRPEEISGSYVGGVDGRRVSVSLQQGELLLNYEYARQDRSHARQDRSRARQFKLAQNGELLFGKNSGSLHHLFFREPGSRAVCLMCGWLAYKKVAAG